MPWGQSLFAPHFRPLTARIIARYPMRQASPPGPKRCSRSTRTRRRRRGCCSLTTRRRSSPVCIGSISSKLFLPRPNPTALPSNAKARFSPSYSLRHRPLCRPRSRRRELRNAGDLERADVTPSPIPRSPRVLAKIIIATGAFMLVAIVFGVAFGGVRVLLKTLFPGKVFDRPEQMDVLQLGLSGKRINSRDFY